MSGGAFDYSQRAIELIADDIEQTILEAGRKIPAERLKEQQYRYSREIPLEEILSFLQSQDDGNHETSSLSPQDGIHICSTNRLDVVG